MRSRPLFTWVKTWGKWLGLLLVSLYLPIGCATVPVEQTNAPLLGFGSPTSISSVRLGMSAWPGWLPWQVAKDKQVFKQQQVPVDLVWYESYLDSLQALKTGKLDANSQTLNDTISSIAAGADQVIVLVNDNSTGNDQIIVRPGITAIADLRGKTIAAEPGTVDHFLLLLGLKQAGLTQADIQFQPMETGAAAMAFAAGKLDAVGVFAPFTTQALKRPGSKALFTSKDFPGAIPDHLVVSRQLVTQHPEQVQALVNTWFATLELLKRNPITTTAIMAKRAGVTTTEYAAYERGTRLFSVSDNLTAFAPGSTMTSLPHAAKVISQFLLENQLIQQQPDLRKLFDDRFVKAYATAHPQP